MSDIVVGIDLGTTNTCAACYLNGQVKVLTSEEGGRVTPSFIFVTGKDQIIVGKVARKLAESTPEFSISEIKRLVGRKFDDPYLQNNLQYFPFVVENDNNEPVITIERKSGKFRRTAEELCTAILKKVKKDVEAKVGHPTDKAVITVPAYFNVTQREVTLSAAQKAGFTVLKLLNEPTAAALSYLLENDFKEENYSVVYDLGGGTFDVAILKRNGNNVDIIGVDGDSHLGGHDFDNLIVDHVCNHLQKQYNYNPKFDQRAMRRLRSECEEAKQTVSLADDTIISLVGLVKDHPNVQIELTKEEFEEMGDKLFQKTIQIVDNCLKSCNISKEQIKEVILSGGSTRIPKIQKLVSSFFNGKEPNKIVNPDECVAEGAAIQAAMLSNHPKQRIDVLKITDVVPLSLGIGDFMNVMYVLIKRNTSIPCQGTMTPVTFQNLQTRAEFCLYEGERKNTTQNRHLGTVVINNLTPAPPGQCEIEFTMSVDQNGILKVKAKEKLRDNIKDLTVNYTRGHRSDKEVKNAIKDAEDGKLEDKRFVRFTNLKRYVLTYCETVTYNFKKKKLDIVYRKTYELCQDLKELVEKMDLEHEQDLKKLRIKIEKECNHIVDKYSFEFMPSLDL